MFNLTKKKVEDLLKVSTMDITFFYDPNLQTSFEFCPFCERTLSEKEYVKKFVSKNYFRSNILPACQDLLKELQEEENKIPYKELSDTLYKEIRVYEIDSKLIPFPHKKDCKLNELKDLYNRMKNFLETKE